MPLVHDLHELLVGVLVLLIGALLLDRENRDYVVRSGARVVSTVVRRMFLLACDMHLTDVGEHYRQIEREVRNLSERAAAGVWLREAFWIAGNLHSRLFVFPALAFGLFAVTVEVIALVLYFRGSPLRHATPFEVNVILVAMLVSIYAVTFVGSLLTSLALRGRVNVALIFPTTIAMALILSHVTSRTRPSLLELPLDLGIIASGWLGGLAATAIYPRAPRALRRLIDALWS